jgi:hypothetical protein
MTVAHGFLQRMQVLAVRRQPFDGHDAVTVGLRREHQTGAHRCVVEQHRAGAAHAMLAADMGASEQKVAGGGNRSRAAAIRPCVDAACHSP